MLLLNYFISFSNHIILYFYLVTITIKSRNVTVKGSRGTLQRSFKHIDLDIQFVNDNKQLKVDLWFGSRKTIAAIRYVQNIYIVEN